jgi:hypothetical protein
VPSESEPLNVPPPEPVPPAVAHSEPTEHPAPADPASSSGTAQAEQPEHVA